MADLLELAVVAIGAGTFTYMYGDKLHIFKLIAASIRASVTRVDNAVTPLLQDVDNTTLAVATVAVLVAAWYTFSKVWFTETGA